MSLTTAAAAAGGKGLAGVFGAVSALRHRDKPLHSRGAVVAGSLERTGVAEPLGVPWLDEPGTEPVRVRVSRSVGLPPPLPDVLGLALRFGAPGDEHDLLLASGGWSPIARHVLLPVRRPERATYTSLFPYDTATGKVVLGARADDERAYGLYTAKVGGPWQRFATVRLQREPAAAADGPLTLDPVVNPLPGLRLPEALAALREPSYRVARRLRGDSAT